MTSPLKPPDGNWWDEPVNRRESIWLGIAGVWSLGIFAWMAGFTQFGEQNPVGDTYEVTPDGFRETVREYLDEADETEAGHVIPPGDAVYVAGARFFWDGLPVQLEAGREYDLHLGTYDVQHGFSIRPEHSLSQQINLQLFPDREWVVPMTFQDPGTYRVICNEFCGVGHNTMEEQFVVVEETDA